MDTHCTLCGDPGGVPTMDHQVDPPGFTLLDQPAVCTGCVPTWHESTRANRPRVRRWLGVDDERSSPIEPRVYSRPVVTENGGGS